jgi:uncharacterized damage-inducible protein DinB
MAFCDRYIREFDHEAVSTRKMLERVPVDKFDWAPHTKSMKLGNLVNHITSFPGRVKMVLNVDQFDSKSPEAVALRPTVPGTTKELIARWDKNIEDMHAAVTEVSEEQLAGTFTWMAGQETIYSLPRKVALRSFILNHMIHHRGQLSVYLRLLDIPVPSIYGPSADEK